MAFPTQIGGNFTDNDFAPCILFAVLFALLVPLAPYRLFAKSSRNFMLINAVIFTVERPVFFALRATMAQSEAKRDSHGLLTYTQLSLVLGSASFISDVVKLLRTIVVRSTYPTGHHDHNHGASTLVLLEDPAREDQPRARFWARRAADITGLLLLVPVVFGIISGIDYPKTLDDQAKSTEVMRFRYISSGLLVGILLVILAGTVFVLRTWPRVEKILLRLIIVSLLLLLLPPVYRLATMYNTTDSVLSTDPGSLAGIAAKTTFYIFHVVPELILSAAFLGLNIRKVFNSGPMGDWRSRDETPEEKERRLREESERAPGDA